ncbi:MAG: hypothetical protein CVU05_09850 [Bacteroidetes bacterium HGW-Bacteroidetes-21]|jgi:hypothetical protein|nr:MAG: hypothetical protein CVU05_09850 [Bacteroidetes bacterium HGW-Bacteroidetes-21]
MKIYLKILILLLLGNSPICAQDLQFGIDSKYYLLGTLSDNMGYSYIKEIADSTPVTWKYEDKYYIINHLDSLFKSSNISNIDKINYHIVNRGKREHYDQISYDLMSIELSQFIRSFYRFNKSKSISQDGYRIYVGRLKYNLLNRSTENQILSFIAGSFFIYGGIDNTEYSISIPNSLSKAYALKRLLVKIGCKSVKYTINREIKPNSHKLNFIPSDKLKLILDHELEIKKELIRKRKG